MYTFIKKIVIFVIPIGSIFIFPVVVLYLSREYYSIKNIVSIQMTKPETIYGPIYSGLDYEYKKLLIREKNPEIVVLGASRAMEFRQEFFKDPEKFVNGSASLANYALDRIEKFVENLPKDSNVKFVIFSLDQEMFRVPPSFLDNDDAIYKPSPSEWFMDAWRIVYLDEFFGKFSFNDLYAKSGKTTNIGMNAILQNNGFRFDGSYQYEKVLHDPNYENNTKNLIDAEYEKIISNRSIFKYSTTVSEDPFPIIDKILEISQKKGITTIGFLSPYPSKLYVQFTSKDDLYTKIARELTTRLENEFSRYNYNFFDFSDIRIIGGNDNEFVEASHGTDKLSLRMIIYMAEKCWLLNQYVDINKLKMMLKNNPGGFLNF